MGMRSVEAPATSQVCGGPSMASPSKPSYCEVPLSKGMTALVDEADYEAVSTHSWWVKKSKDTEFYYAIREDSDGRTIWMHREILGLKFGDSRIGDHKEPTQTLDNRRSNLRIVTPLESAWNRRRNSRNTSGFKGVFFDSTRNQWRASIRVRGKSTTLGRFQTPEEAYAVYCDASKIHHGEFGRIA
jgi:AP2 domain